MRRLKGKKILNKVTSPMSSKKSKKANGKSEEAKKPGAVKPGNQESSPENDPFDFGGLPKRDLKKNLGCG